MNLLYEALGRCDATSQYPPRWRQHKLRRPAPATSHKARMRGAFVRCTFAKPGEQASVCTGAFEIRVSRRSVFTAGVTTRIDAAKGQRRFVKRDRIS